MEKKGSHQHPSTVNSNFSFFFTDPSLRWAARRMICKLPDTDQACTKKDGAMPPPSLALTKRSTLDKKHEGVQASVATSKKGNGSPDSSACAQDRFNLRPKGAVNIKNAAKKAATAIKFAVELTEDEIMADFMAMTGRKPPNRPKRLPKKTRENLAGIFPGSELPKNITAKRYGVRR